MSTMVGQMTKDELKELIETLIEQKLLELLGDPEEGRELRKSVRDRLLRQKKAVAAGERGEPLEDVVRRLGLGWRPEPGREIASPDKTPRKLPGRFAVRESGSLLR